MKGMNGHSSFDFAQLDPQAREIMSRYDQKRAAMLTLLHLAQDKAGFITPEAEAWVSKWTDTPVVHVREVVTFYTMYRRQPGGRHVIRFCTTTSCVLMGGELLFDRLQKKLGIRNGETTPDGRVTLEGVECLCACEIAPMMQVNDDYHGPLTEKKIDEILDGLK